MNFLPGLESLRNIHPLFVHFPIALILVTLLFEGLWWITKKDQYRFFATYLLYLSALSAITTVITGFIASDSFGHDSPGHDFVHEHRDVMLWMSGILLVTTLSVIFVRSLREGKMRRLLILALFVISALLVYGADKGGRLVFEFGMGVKGMSGQAVQESHSHEHEDQHESELEEDKPSPETVKPDSTSIDQQEKKEGKVHVHKDGKEHVHEH